MKRIVLGISVLLMLVQNGFAKTDSEYDKQIKNDTMEVNKQNHRCDKATLNHKYSSNPEVCLKALNILQTEYPNAKAQIASILLNTGVLYKYSDKNYLKAYQYYMKAAKLGSTQAQINLDILCKEHPWACK